MELTTVTVNEGQDAKQLGSEKDEEAGGPVSTKQTGAGGAGAGETSSTWLFVIFEKTVIYVLLAVCVVFFVGTIVTYFLYDKSFKQNVAAIEDTCSNNDANVDLLKKPPRQELSVFAYNITNPFEYVTGSTAKVNELGPYGMSLLPVRDNLELSKAEGTITFDLYNDVSFSEKTSAEGLNLDNKIYVPNAPYLGLFSTAQNEGSLVLTMTCSTTQIAAMQNKSLTTYCTAATLATNPKCKCCSTTTTGVPAGTLQCKNLLLSSGKPAQIISWLAKFDNGIKLSGKASPNFLFSTGTYTPLIKHVSVSEMSFGTTSSLLGFFKTSEAVKANDFSTLYANSNVTKDLRDACSSVCPKLSDVSLAFQNTSAFKTSVYECHGNVPSTDVLAGLLSETRALELRYLEGASCYPFSVTLAINALLLNDINAVKTCADGSALTVDNACCLKKYVGTAKSGSLTGAGLGCHFFTNGLIQSRRVYSNDEAKLYLKPTPETQFNSGCAHGEDKFQQTIWRGQRSFDGWFTPATYTYPNMPWADPTVIKGARTKKLQGHMQPFNVSGYQAALRDGTGITTGFGEFQLTDGKPQHLTSNIWSAFKYGVTPVEYIRNRKVKGVETNHYLPVVEKKTNKSDIEALQKSGVVPYQNMNNLVYALSGIPVIMSFPNFYESDENMLSQSNNQDKKTALQTGVNLYRTRDGYSSSSPLLASPLPITTETWDEFGLDNFRGYLDIEPATGLTLEGKIANQFSVYTWNCNPTLDSSCGMQKNVTGTTCYHTATSAGPVYFPCSFANVFTPKVMGGKVIPIYWLYTTPGAPTQAANDLVAGINGRYALAVLVIFIPIVAFLFAVILLYCLTHHFRGTTQHTKVPTNDK